MDWIGSCSSGTVFVRVLVNHRVEVEVHVDCVQGVHVDLWVEGSTGQGEQP